ncbi:NAD(P)-dependent alcohol dehydrogenase [Streptomyces sp. E11-3]|uniref:NAD(P)-dependent alcohol dehydrogenase n=1 Tax=Streptomyces sp. E11-3 TaxID=3110112 RepID=UPI003981228A
MKAIVQDAYGSADALELREIDQPVVGEYEVLVRVHAASVHPDVWHVVRGLPYVLRLMGAGLRRPKNPVPGTDVAGRVEAVGKRVTRFAPGDEVFGESVTGYSWANGGAFAEYAAVAQDSLAPKPGNVTFEQAAAVPSSGFIVLQNLRAAGQVKAGQRVLVNGAGGGVGTLAVQLAKAYGAEVTGVDSTTKLDAIRSLGTDHVIDYTQEDFTRGGERYDLVFDVPGNHSFSACRRALTPQGTYLLIGHDHFGERGHRLLGSLPRFLRLAVLSPFVRQLPRPSLSILTKKEAMSVLSGFLESGELTPLVDRTFPLSEVPEAIRYLGEGQACGKVVVTM